MSTNNLLALYERIMKNVAVLVKKILNEAYSSSIIKPILANPNIKHASYNTWSFWQKEWGMRNAFKVCRDARYNTDSNTVDPVIAASCILDEDIVCVYHHTSDSVDIYNNFQSLEFFKKIYPNVTDKQLDTLDFKHLFPVIFNKIFSFNLSSFEHSANIKALLAIYPFSLLLVEQDVVLLNFDGTKRIVTNLYKKQQRINNKRKEQADELFTLETDPTKEDRQTKLKRIKTTYKNITKYFTNAYKRGGTKKFEIAIKKNSLFEKYPLTLTYAQNNGSILLGNSSCNNIVEINFIPAQCMVHVLLNKNAHKSIGYDNNKDHNFKFDFLVYISNNQLKDQGMCKIFTRDTAKDILLAAGKFLGECIDKETVDISDLISKLSILD